jgi:hypothetical protein
LIPSRRAGFRRADQVRAARGALTFNSERGLDQLSPARLRTVQRHLGEPCFAEVTLR